MSGNRFTLRSAVYLAPIKQNKILLLRRYNTGWMDGHYSLISGHIDGNETMFDAMIREAYEEAGIRVKAEDLQPVHTIHRWTEESEYIDFFFSAYNWENTPKIMEKDKCDDMRWFEQNNLPNNFLPYIKVAFDKHKNGIPFSYFGWK